MKPRAILVTASLCASAGAASVSGQASSRPCAPVSGRADTARPACVTSVEILGRLPPRPMFWHLDTYPTTDAAVAARGSRGTIVDSLGKVWLFTIAEHQWRPSGGVRLATIGPLPVSSDAEYTAVYMESIFEPGMTAAIHRHSGPEAFYTLTGQTCLETPDGVIPGDGDGHSLVVPAGPPMLLTATGTTRRRAMALILHDSAQPATTMVQDWTPKGLCTR